MPARSELSRLHSQLDAPLADDHGLLLHQAEGRGIAPLRPDASDSFKASCSHTHSRATSSSRASTISRLSIRCMSGLRGMSSVFVLYRICLPESSGFGARPRAITFAGMISAAPHCDVCGRRNVVAYAVEPGAAWRTVVLNRWRNVCPSWFDAEAERARALHLQRCRSAILVRPAAAPEPLQAQAIETP
jgi:hypothetical protein